MPLKDARILVTGANGFLGGRLVEFLSVRHQAEVRALVRDPRRSVRLCRLPVEMVVGNVRDERSMRRAIEGCSIVVHCASAVDASSPRASSTFVGTKIVALAAREHHVARLVHVSSAAVYGSPGNVEVTEECPLNERWKGDVYGAAKIAGEQIIMDGCSQGLAATIIQPTIIYGPYSTEWSVAPLNTLRQADYVVPTTGRCNPVYVDDVVQSIILAATNHNAIGKRYIVSGRETVSWRDFYEYYSRMGTEGQIIALGEEEYRRLAKQKSSKSLAEVARAIARSPEVRGAAKDNRIFQTMYAFAQRVVPKRKLRRIKGEMSPKASEARRGAGEVMRPSICPGLPLWQLYRSESRYSIGKATDEIGYEPQMSLEHGMELTGQWAKWARLI
jgi:nucleoside-diphosphate-sugar epimerase